LGLWSTVLVVTRGDHIETCNNCEKCLNVYKLAFSDALKIGLWSMSDA
jgi:hypothetical protein